MAHARLQKMSMYSQLLAASLDATGLEGPSLEASLLHELEQCRRRLGPQERSGGLDRGGAASDTFGNLACQIDYDLVLIRLSQLHGIDCHPALFTRPLPERQRLEEALRAAGVKVGDAADPA